ncbi:hypothetical protein HGRIS_000884 [Hohenbuehelia grisea]|uniref:Major facilitator superfamily (MFS) profile domain-containing protein n=1 Tax=Hohenbuehelia grisea TaxID=104357 RepID=A0ABR3IQ28_9AGAR
MALTRPSSPAPTHSAQDLPDEERPLLVKDSSIPWRTPLNWPQIYIVLLMQLCEPLASQSIYPYINQLISELDITGGDDRKVGYYAGLIESLFFLTQAFTVLSWSRVSDHVGRKPVLLIGMAGLAISMLSFGLSRVFWALVVSRCICGMLNGNIGVMKSAMGELTDSTNRAEGFSLMPVVWSAGVTIGPLIGGGLSKPHTRFPSVFSNPFWEEYPYFLPCAVVSAFTALIVIISAISFKETLHPRRASSDDSSPHEAPVPMRALFERRVLVAVFNYVMLAFLDIGLNTLQPLFFAMPVAIGGLGLSPPTIGYILGTFGALNGSIQALFFARIINRWNPKRVFFVGIAAFIPIYCLFPVMSAVKRSDAPPAALWTLVCVQLAFMVVMDLSYGCIFMFVTAAAPNKHSLGSTNGLAQTTVSIARAIGPALTASMFSFSLEHNILGGYAVYAVLVVASAIGLVLATRLPDKGWKDRSDGS